MSGCGGPQTGKMEPNILKKQKRGSLKSLSEIWVLPFKQSDQKKKKISRNLVALTFLSQENLTMLFPCTLFLVQPLLNISPHLEDNIGLL